VEFLISELPRNFYEINIGRIKRLDSSAEHVGNFFVKLINFLAPALFLNKAPRHCLGWGKFQLLEIFGRVGNSRVLDRRLRRRHFWRSQVHGINFLDENLFFYKNIFFL
jgi:hypothetical protein